MALLAAVMSASVAISIKFLSRTEKPDAIVIYTTLLWVPMSLLPALFVWQTPVGHHLAVVGAGRPVRHRGAHVLDARAASWATPRC